jgi:hypothetical protein
VSKDSTIFEANYRELRAQRFADAIIRLMIDHIPASARRKAWDDLFNIAARDNLEIIKVPPEHDALTELENAMLTAHPALVRATAD